MRILFCSGPFVAMELLGAEFEFGLFCGKTLSLVLSWLRITMVWNRRERSASVWSLSEPTNVCKELSGKHRKTILSVFKIAAPHRHVTSNK